MPQFFVLAYDGTDAEAPTRRRAARAAHFEQIRPMVEKGELRAAGAILDDEGTMIGSALFMEFPSRTELEAWLDRDPYVSERVWQRIEINPSVSPCWMARSLREPMSTRDHRSPR